MNEFTLTNITFSVRVTNLCNLYKYYGIVTYSSISTLLGLFLAVSNLTPDIYGTTIYFEIVMKFIVIGQFGRSF